MEKPSPVEFRLTGPRELFFTSQDVARLPIVVVLQLKDRGGSFAETYSVLAACSFNLFFGVWPGGSI